MNRKKNGQFETVSPTLRHDFFSLPLTNEAAYVIGLLSADGCVKSDRHWGLTQTGIRGQELLRCVQSLINHGGKITHPGEITITSREQIADLDVVGITQRKTKTLRWPTCLGNSTTEYLRGYLDGDGWCNNYDNGRGDRYLHVGITGTEQFIASCGAAVPITGNARPLKQQWLWSLVWNGKKAENLWDWLFTASVPFESDKAQRAREWMHRAS